jgi:hypothetical protein
MMKDPREEIARRGLRLIKRGAGWRIVGHGVDLLIADLRHLHPHDLEPPRPGERRSGG